MDVHMFRRERLLASGLLRQAAPSELALLARGREAAQEQTPMPPPGGAVPPPLPPRPSYRPGKPPRAVA
jgi:hypothetical protein